MTQQLNLNNIVKDVISYEVAVGNLSTDIVSKNEYINDLNTIWDILFTNNNAQYFEEKAIIEQDLETQVSSFIDTILSSDSISVTFDIYSQLSTELSNTVLSNYTFETFAPILSVALINRDNYVINDADFEKLSALNQERNFKIRDISIGGSFDDLLPPEAKKKLNRIKSHVYQIGNAAFGQGVAISNKWRNERNNILESITQTISDITTDINNGDTKFEDEDCSYATQIQNYSSRICNLIKDIAKQLNKLKQKEIKNWNELFERIGQIYGYVYNTDIGRSLLEQKLNELTYKIFSLDNNKTKILNMFYHQPITDYDISNIFEDLEFEITNDIFGIDYIDIDNLSDSTLGLHELNPSREFYLTDDKKLGLLTGFSLLTSWGIWSTAGETAYAPWIVKLGAIGTGVLIEVIGYVIIFMIPSSAGAEPDIRFINGAYSSIFDVDYNNDYFIDLRRKYNECIDVHKQLHSKGYKIIEKINHYCVRRQEDGCANEVAHMQNGLWDNCVYIGETTEETQSNIEPVDGEWDNTLSAYIVYSESFETNNTTNGHGEPVHYPVDVNVHE